MENFEKNKIDFEELRGGLKTAREEEAQKKERGEYFNPNLAEMKIEDLTQSDLEIWQEFSSRELTPIEWKGYTDALDKNNEGSKNLAAWINNQLMMAGDWFDLGEYARLMGELPVNEPRKEKKENLLDKLKRARGDRRLQEFRRQLDELNEQKTRIEMGEAVYPETLKLPEVKEKIQKAIDEIQKLKRELNGEE